MSYAKSTVASKSSYVLLASFSFAVLISCGDDSSPATTVDSGTNSSNACAASYVSNTGCNTFTDMTAMSTVTITFGTSGFSYSPKCLKVKKGTKVTFMGDFTSHPLRSACGPSSVIKNTDTGSSAEFTLGSDGTYGYYCNFHGSAGDGSGMAGMIEVVP